MSTIVTRAGKGSPLTNTELDANFVNLNTDKVEKTAADITGGSINGTTVGASTASTGAFTTLTSSSTTTLNGTTIPASKTLLVSTDIGTTVQGYDADLAAFALKTAPTGAVVGTTDTQTLTNKTISADDNTLSGIAASSFVLSNASGNIDGLAAQKAIPSGVVVGSTDTQTLTNKTIDGASNTLTNLPYANITEPVRHSVRPSLLLDFANTKTLDPRITFTRGSTATCYDGKTVVKAEENLLLQSQDFTATGWAVAGATTTANTATAPDGTTTADSLTENTSNVAHELYRIFSCVSGSTYTFSAYVKASGRTKVQMRCQATSVIYEPRFDLTAVTATNIVGTGTATITDAGNGWYRITATTTATASGNGYWQLNLLDAAATSLVYTGDGTSGVYLWGAQLEQRSSATAYTPTTTSAITNYIPALQTAASGVARFEHNPVTGESLGLEIEEQRTNLLVRSEEFDNASWTKSACTASANNVISPDGQLNADRLFEDSTTAEHWIQQASTVTTATAYTYTIYAKAGGRTKFRMREVGATNATVVFDLTSATISSTTNGGSGTITSVGNGWYRCSLTFTSSGTTAALRVFLLDESYNASYAGNNWSGIYIWGAQLEAGSFATSYIPTVASQVTRSADSASMTGTNFSSWYRADEGTLYASFKTVASTLFPQAFMINDGSSSQAIFIDAYLGLRGYVSNLGQGQASFSSSKTGTGDVVSMGYKVNDFASSFNGASAVSDTLGTIPVVDRAFIGCNYSAGQLNGTIKKLAYYPKRLTNAELQGLTTV